MLCFFLQAYLRQIETKAVIPGRRRAGCKPGKKLKVQKVPPPTKIICIQEEGFALITNK